MIGSINRNKVTTILLRVRVTKIHAILPAKLHVFIRRELNIIL